MRYKKVHAVHRGGHWNVYNGLHRLYSFYFPVKSTFLSVFRTAACSCVVYMLAV